MSLFINLKISCNLTGQQPFGPWFENLNFARYRISSELSVTNLVFILHYFQRKPMTFFKKSEKPCFGLISSIFFLNLGKNDFLRKKGICHFLNIPYIYHLAKNKKKLMINSWEKCPTDRQTDRKQWFYRTHCRTGVQK